jgi:hypothetical protein
MDTLTDSLPPPITEMSQLKWFIGQWVVVSRYLNDDQEWVEETIRAEHTPILGGHVIFEHFGGPLFGKPFEAWSLRKFNPNSGQWEQRWVDVTPGGFADWTGQWSANEHTFTGHPNRVLNDDGSLKDSAAREMFYDITDDRFAWKYERTEDGGKSWRAIWTLAYTRQP